MSHYNGRRPGKQMPVKRANAGRRYSKRYSR